MGLLAVSLIVASLVYLVVNPPAWLPPMLLKWLSLGGPAGADEKKPSEEPYADDDTAPRIRGESASDGSTAAPSGGQSDAPKRPSSPGEKLRDGAAMPPPTIRAPAAAEPDSPTTPKASASQPSQPVPSLILSDEPPSEPSAPSSVPKPDSAMMPPPPLPGRAPSAGRLPSLPQFPAANSAQRARLPIPNRGPPSLSPGGLAPPPTHSSRPQKPSRQVTLEPGHSPLDWARISGPSADLRGLDPSAPYMRVPPSLLKEKTGRRGKDAWMAINGKVYNITPYAKFHPGGVPELMRGAGRDGTKLFGEIHPWVNYETMLAACLVGLLVEEPTADSQESDMDKMD